MIEFPDHPFFEEMSEEERIEFLGNVIAGALTLGIPEAYLMAEAIITGNEEQFWSSLRVTAVLHGMWFTAHQTVVLWDIFRHGGKNVMSFHRAMQGLGVLRSMLLRTIASSPPVILAASAVANQYLWSKIGDSKTGSVYWARSGDISGGSLPIISELPTWRGVQKWWKSL